LRKSSAFLPSHSPSGSRASLARFDLRLAKREARSVHGALRRAGVSRHEVNVVETAPDPARLLDTQLAQGAVRVALDAAVAVVAGFGVADEIEHLECGGHGGRSYPRRLVRATALVANTKVGYPSERRPFTGCNMIPLVSEAIQNYADTHSSPEPELFAELARETRATQKDPQMMVGHSEGLLLRLLVVIARARRVLEIGTFTGYSALAMAMGLPADGELVTCDVDPEATTVAQKYWDRSPPERRSASCSRRIGHHRHAERPFDLVFIDADKPNYIRYWDSVLGLVRAGGLIVADNVLWSGRVLDPKEASDRALAAFNDHVQRDVRVEHVMLRSATVSPSRSSAEPARRPHGNVVQDSRRRLIVLALTASAESRSWR
jgi:caffeoyl-CoA O-methyltransferase